MLCGLSVFASDRQMFDEWRQTTRWKSALGVLTDRRSEQRSCEILKHLDINMEFGNAGLVALADHAIEKRIARFALVFEHVQLAAARIHEQAKVTGRFDSREK